MNFSHSQEENSVQQTLSRTSYFEGSLISVHVDEVVIEGQRRRFELVSHSAAAVIVACPAPDQLVLVKQWRQGAGRHLWEVPAGCLEVGEQPEAGALRELREETGYQAERLTFLWSVYSAPGYCDELLHFFVADALIAGERELDEGEEHMVMQTFHVSEVLEMMMKGQIQDMKSLLAIRWFTEQHQRTLSS